MPRKSPGPKLDINRVNTHILPEFGYLAPATLDELLNTLRRVGGEAKILAGGTDLLVRMKQGVLRPKYLVSLRRVKELRGIEDRGDCVVIKAATRLRDIERSEVIRQYFTALHEAVEWMGSVQIRNMATIGGNLCNASPAADTAPPLLVFDASVRILSAGGERVVPLKDFFRGPGRTVLREDEVLAEILVPKPTAPTGSAFIKVARVAMDLAKVSVAVALRMDGGVVSDVRVALGSVAPTPIRAYRTEEFLKGRELSEEVLEKAAEIVRGEVKPITDVRSTAEYRRFVSGVILKDALRKARDRLLGGG